MKYLLKPEDIIEDESHTYAIPSNINGADTIKVAELNGTDGLAYITPKIVAECFEQDFLYAATYIAHIYYKNNTPIIDATEIVIELEYEIPNTDDEQISLILSREEKETIVNAIG